MVRRLVTVSRVVYGAAGLGLLLVGVPVLLGYAIGWPLPRELPTWEEFRSALGGSSVSDATILKLLAIVGWLAWGQVLASTVTELAAWVRGRAAPLVPLAGPVQPFIRHLLLCVLLFGAATKASPAPAPVHAAFVSAADPQPVDMCPPPARSAVDGPVAAPASPATPTYTVKPRDSLWKIAEELLGDGFRWRELFDLNHGVPQADGRALHDPDLIRPGWSLRLPADASVPAPPPPAPSAPPTTPTPSAAPVEPSTTSTMATATPTTLAPGTSDEAVASVDGGTPSSRPDTAATDREDGDGDGVPAPVGLAGAGLLAAGLVMTLTRLRRAQVRRREPGRGVPQPGPEAADAERRLRSVAALDRAERLALAMRAVGACLSAADRTTVPAIDAVLVGDDVEILFSQPVGAEPGPFRVEAGRAWTLAGSTESARVEALARDASSIAPALVTVGRIGERDLLIDLERAGVSSIESPDTEGQLLAWSMAACLAASPWSDDVRVIVTDDLLAGFDGVERVEKMALADAAEHVSAETRATRNELASSGVPTTLGARLAGGSWTPTVVFANADDSADEDFERLSQLAAPGGGLAVVVTGRPASSDRRLVIDGSAVRVVPPGVTAALPDLPEELRAAIGQLVASATPGAEQGAKDVIDLTEPEPAEPALAVPTAGPLPEGAVLVRVLGSVDIEGGRVIDRRKSEELVVYLALHADGADEQALKTALWPDTLPAPHAFNQVVSRARICMGTAPDGSHYLPRLEAGRYRLNEWVTSDVDRLAGALRAARSHPSTESIDELSSALRLVRGQPFEGVKTGYEWAHSEGIATRSEIVAADAAHLVAEWYLDREEPTPALWAAGQGLLASPYDEALYRDRMRAYAMSGNDAAVESVMRELCRAVDAVEPYDSLHPETLELFESLTRRRVC